MRTVTRTALCVLAIAVYGLPARAQEDPKDALARAVFSSNGVTYVPDPDRFYLSGSEMDRRTLNLRPWSPEQPDWRANVGLRDKNGNPKRPWIERLEPIGARPKVSFGATVTRAIPKS
ncbi:MAG: hypothetical protein AB199_03400 [Parcubacteria bacterium C7867-004]|nr:MAG: hypothetical protein AB199_03400 [Parcubacteria bacterium C7867-004]